MYNQYSLNPRRRKTLDEKRGEVWANYPDAEVRNPRTCTSHNRSVITYPNGTRAFRLHDTDVVTVLRDVVIFRDGGWETMTTRRAMTEGLQELLGLMSCVYVYSNQPKTAHLLRNPLTGRDWEFDCPFVLPIPELSARRKEHLKC